VGAAPGRRTVYLGSGQVNSLREEVVARVRSRYQRTALNIDTVDNILASNGLDRVDLMIIQINGSELEALAGMARSMERVRNFAVAAPYGENGGNNKEAVASVLDGAGFEVEISNFVYARRR